MSSICLVCCPAVMINGVLFRNAVRMQPMAFPMPAPVWTLTITGLRNPWARPSAIPTTLAS